MTPVQKLQLEQSQARQKINGILTKEDGEVTAEERTELSTLTERSQEIEVELRAAIVAEAADAEERQRQFDNETPDAEHRNGLSFDPKRALPPTSSPAGPARCRPGRKPS